MAAMSDYLENKIIDYIFRGTTTAFNPTTVYIGLHTSATNDAGGGTEVSGGSYAREQVGPGDANWANTAGGSGAVNSGTGGLTDNLADITFTTASASWGTVSHVAIWDAVSGGNMLFHGSLTASKTIDNGDTFKFAIGDLDVTLA